MQRLTVKEVCLLLRALKLGIYEERFKYNNVDGVSLSVCEFFSDLEELGVEERDSAEILSHNIANFRMNGVPLDYIMRRKRQIMKSIISSEGLDSQCVQVVGELIICR